MYIFLLSILLTVLGGLGLYLDCHDKIRKPMCSLMVCIFGAISFIVGITGLLCCALAGTEHTDRAYYNVYEKHQQYEHVYQFVIGNVEDVPGGDVLTVNLADLAAYNAEVIRKKSERESKWINWWACPAYDVIYPFDLNLVLCGCVPDDTIEADIYEEEELPEE